jgi:hypothetical protein
MGHRLFKAAAAISFAAAPTSATAAPVLVADPLTVLYDCWQQLVRFRTYNDEEVESLTAMLMEVEQEIAATPATTALGLWAKIQIVKHYSAQMEGALDHDLVASLLADTERLIDRPAEELR